MLFKTAILPLRLIMPRGIKNTKPEEFYTTHEFESSSPVSPHTTVRVHHKWNQTLHINLIRQTKSIAFCVYIGNVSQIHNPINIDMEQYPCEVAMVMPVA